MGWAVSLEQDRSLAAAVAALEVPAGDGWRLRLVFHAAGDRLGHTLWLVALEGASTLLGRSQEGVAEERWPPSPPLQALHQQTLPDGRPAILLVGMAGRSHWSCSIEPLPGAAALRCDLACRHPDQPGWIGSTYQLAGAAEEELQVVPLPGAVVERLAEGCLVRPAAAPVQAGTVRWAYELRLRRAAAQAGGPA